MAATAKGIQKSEEESDSPDQHDGLSHVATGRLNFNAAQATLNYVRDSSVPSERVILLR